MKRNVMARARTTNGNKMKINKDPVSITTSCSLGLCPPCTQQSDAEAALPGTEARNSGS